MKKSVVLMSLVSVTVALAAIPASAASFTDPFDRPDSYGLGSPWSSVSSTWAVRSNGARFLTGPWRSTTGLAVVDAGTTQVSVSADITLSSTPQRSNAGLALAVKDYKNNLFCKIESTSKNPYGLMAIGRRLDGVTTSQLAAARNVGFANGRTYHVVCARQGDTITMTVGARTISYMLTPADIEAFGSATKLGLRGHIAPDEDDGGSVYDKFDVRDGSMPPPEPTSLRVVAIADVCGNVNWNCRQTAALVQSLDPDFVIAAGDTENTPNATIADYENIFDPAWGPLVPLMYPVPGNHEYNDPTNGPGAEGYRAYFPDDHAPATGPLYYSFNAGNWHFVGLDTDRCQAGENCPSIDETTDTQFQWMVDDLATDTHTCDIAYGHHPAFSSPGYVQGGRHGSIGWMVPAWKQMVASGVDLYFSGHDADYERFPAMDVDGVPSPTGTRQFVVGTGGAGQLAFGDILPQSEFHHTGLSATVLTLSDTSYSWQLVSTTGAIVDQGGPVACH